MTGPSDLYCYKATIIKWVDGDTAKVDVDLGCRVHWHGSLRCARYNSPEVYGPSKPEGDKATYFVEKECPVGSTIYIKSLAFVKSDELDSFGRMLAEVTLADGRNLADVMIESGYAMVD